MKISYDPEVDALSITFREMIHRFNDSTLHLSRRSPMAKAERITGLLPDVIAADYDSERRLARRSYFFRV